MTRVAIAALLLSCTGAMAAQGGAASDFPARPIRIIVGFTPGGQPDIFSRMIGGRLGEALGQPIVVDTACSPGATRMASANSVAGTMPPAIKNSSTAA